MPRFDVNQLKTQLKLALGRIKLQQNKKRNNVLAQKRMIAEMLSKGNDESARIKVESIIREDFIIEAYDILHLFCEVLLTRINVIAAEPCLPDEVREAVYTIVYAAPRTEIPELRNISNLLINKYGKQFAADAAENCCGQVNARIVHKLRVQTPEIFLVYQYLNEIARANGVAWSHEPPPSEIGIMDCCPVPGPVPGIVPGVVLQTPASAPPVHSGYTRPAGPPAFQSHETSFSDLHAGLQNTMPSFPSPPGHSHPQVGAGGGAGFPAFPATPGGPAFPAFPSVPSQQGPSFPSFPSAPGGGAPPPSSFPSFPSVPSQPSAGPGFPSFPSVPPSSSASQPPPSASFPSFPSVPSSSSHTAPASFPSFPSVPSSSQHTAQPPHSSFPSPPSPQHPPQQPPASFPSFPSAPNHQAGPPPSSFPSFPSFPATPSSQQTGAMGASFPSFPSTPASSSQGPVDLSSIELRMPSVPGGPSSGPTSAPPPADIPDFDELTARFEALKKRNM